MKTEFEFFDENSKLTKANLILSFEHNNKKYIIYEVGENNRPDLDILHVREYEEINKVPHLYKVSNEELAQVKSIVANIYKSIE